MKTSFANQGFRVECECNSGSDTPPVSAGIDSGTKTCESASVVVEKANPTGETGMHSAASIQIPRWKRILDLTCVLLSLPLWLVLMVLVTLWIKLVSPGPIFYRQERIGYRRKRFMVLKFRSMKVNAETQTHEQHLERLMQTDCPMTKLDATGDPRVIPFGRLLRATGLDELPQIFNILRGEMSLVGPRPCTPHEFQRYQTRHQERVNAPPGLTGYWQVHGKNKATFSEMIEMDIFYGENMSVRLDLEILLKTVPAIFAQILESRTQVSDRSGTHKPVIGTQQS